MGERDSWPDPDELVTYEVVLQSRIEDGVLNHEQADTLLTDFIRYKFSKVFDYFMGSGTD